jgi:hypothetical protein
MKNYKKELKILTDSLKNLLDILKEEKKEAMESMQFSSEGMLVNYVDIGGINYSISCLKNLLSTPNESFNFLKELIKAEQVFKNVPYFPKFRHFVPDREIVYAEIDNQIDELGKKSHELKDDAYSKATKLISSLRKLTTDLFVEQTIKYPEYKVRAIEIIETQREGLDTHVGFKEILANLLILIATLGTAQLVNKKVTGNLLFFTKTDSCEKLDTLIKTIEDREQYFPSTSKA